MTEPAIDAHKAENFAMVPKIGRLIRLFKVRQGGVGEEAEADECDDHHQDSCEDGPEGHRFIPSGVGPCSP